MQLKQRIRKLEQDHGVDVTKLSDGQLQRLADCERAKYPKRHQAFDEIYSSLSESELIAIRNNNLSAVSTETILRLKNAYQITN